MKIDLHQKKKIPVNSIFLNLPKNQQSWMSNTSLPNCLRNQEVSNRGLNNKSRVDSFSLRQQWVLIHHKLLLLPGGEEDRRKKAHPSKSSTIFHFPDRYNTWFKPIDHDISEEWSRGSCAARACQGTASPGSFNLGWVAAVQMLTPHTSGLLAGLS